jgi:hypothetical protein
MWDSKIWSLDPRGSDQRKIALASIYKFRPVFSSERAPHKKKKIRNCHTSNKYMARCQEWPCRLIAGSKLLLCSALRVSLERNAVARTAVSSQWRTAVSGEESPVVKGRQSRKVASGPAKQLSQEKTQADSGRIVSEGRYSSSKKYKCRVV